MHNLPNSLIGLESTASDALKQSSTTATERSMAKSSDVGRADFRDSFNKEVKDAKRTETSGHQKDKNKSPDVNSASATSSQNTQAANTDNSKIDTSEAATGDQPVAESSVEQSDLESDNGSVVAGEQVISNETVNPTAVPLEGGPFGFTPLAADSESPIVAGIQQGAMGLNAELGVLQQDATAQQADGVVSALQPEQAVVDASAAANGVLANSLNTKNNGKGAPTTLLSNNAGALSSGVQSLGVLAPASAGDSQTGAMSAEQLLLDTSGKTAALAEGVAADSASGSKTAKTASPLVAGEILAGTTAGSMTKSETRQLQDAGITLDVKTEKLDLSDGAKVSVPNVVGGLTHLEAQSASGARIQHIPVNISFGKPQWVGMVAERTAMMAAQNIKSAELHLDPPDLGPVQVRVHVHNDQVSVSFVSSHSNVRESLDATANRLRELMDSQGMDLLDVDVSDQSSHEQEQPELTHGYGSSSETEDEVLAGDTTPVKISVSSGIDYYA